MSAYKEIQVPVEKVKEVYEKFYKELKELEPAATEKEQKLWESWKEFDKKEEELRKQYYLLLGGYDLGPGYNFSYPPSSQVKGLLGLCEQIFEAVSHSTGTITMTPSQVHDLELAQNGKWIAQVKKYISDPIVQEQSIYQEMIYDLLKEKEKKSVTPKTLKQEKPVVDPGDQGSFGGAIFGIVCLFALVCVMIKSCS